MEAHKIIITGAATRMGAAIAKKLSGPDIEIVIHYNKSKASAENLKKKLTKNKEISEDEERRLQELIQKNTDMFISEIDSMIDVKEKDLLTI